MRRKVRKPEAEERRQHARVLARHVGRDGAWPLEAPGMPPPGPDFVRAAGLLGGDAAAWLRELYRRALREPGFTLEVEGRGGFQTVTFVPGHLWGPADADTPPVPAGPCPADVMVVGKMPWHDETRCGRNLVGASGQVLREALARVGAGPVDGWYVTNLCKFTPPDDARDLRAAWVRDCLPLLHQELRVVRPRFVLCLGGEATRWLLGPGHNVQNMAGRAVTLAYDCRPSADDPPDTHRAAVMTVLHPVNVAKDPALLRTLEAGLARFVRLTRGLPVGDDGSDVDHRVCRTLDEARAWYREAAAEIRGRPPEDRLIAWDLEWHGRWPGNRGAYVRTVQCSWAERKAVTFVLRRPGGATAFCDGRGRPAVRRLVRLLNRFARCGRTVGHFLVADLEWAGSIGLRLVDHCPVPLYDDPQTGRPAWERLRDGEGWLDTAMMSHAVEETAPLGLESLAVRYTTAPRYDGPLEAWKAAYARERNLKKEELEGYGDCPDEVLVPYANYDADVTRRVAVALLPRLDCDYEGHCVWEPFWESMIVQKPILRIRQHGILVDRGRIDDLTRKFVERRARKEEEIRAWARWPDFNVRSVQQVREFLFGEAYNGRRTPDGRPVRLRPEGAVSLAVEPVLDTSKPPRPWRELVERGLDRDASPSTSKTVLGVLAQEHLHDGKADQINMVRDYRFLDQVLKSVLRDPKTDDGDRWVENDEGFLEYDAGLAHCIDDDGRVRTHLFPTAETGRWKSRRPNLQNISKSRDPDYVRLLGGDYTHTLRSVLRASPGYALVEADYTGAELYGMAIMAGSRLMQEHCRRAHLPESGYDEHGRPTPGGVFPHPDHYDIHSNIAVKAFRLDCPPTKAGLQAAGRGHFRNLAKRIIFGLAYGLQVRSLLLQAREQGIAVTADEMARLSDTVFDTYPELADFRAEACRRAVEERWLCSCFGRFRRFPRSDDDPRLAGECERQAMNFPIQSLVASCIDRGVAYFVDRVETLGLGDRVRLLLTIHDAVLVEAAYADVATARDLIRWAFVDMVEIWPTDLAGRPRGDGPYRLGMEVEVSDHWGERFAPETAERLGFDPKPVKFAAS